ncbi:MarR family winged helix-turn-helix transcriptional regulator [Clostridium sp. Marseille-QA1073]
MRELFGKYITVLNRYQQILINHKLKEYELGSGQYFFLINIYQNEGISQKDLTSLVKTDKATTAKALIKLEKHGYIYRITDNEDKRYNKLYLTQKGSEFMPTLMNILYNITESFMDGIDSQRCNEMLETLNMILGNAETLVELLRREKKI